MRTPRRAGSAETRVAAGHKQGPSEQEPSVRGGQCWEGTGLLWCLLPGTMIMHFGGRVGNRQVLGAAHPAEVKGWPQVIYKETKAQF